MPPLELGVLFDIDATLVDTTYLHAAGTEAPAANAHSVPMADVHPAIGMGTQELLEHLLGPAVSDGAAAGKAGIPFLGLTCEAAP